MSREYLLAIDNGTQSIRALLFDLHGNLLHKVKLSLGDYQQPNPGWFEQDPDYFWEMVCTAVRQLWSESDYTADMVAGVAVTTQRSTLINVDQHGRPLRPAIVWMDQRRAQNVPPVSGIWGVIFPLIGMRHTISQLQADAEANWISRHQPEIWEKTHKFLLLSGYLNYKLCGRFVDSVGSQVGYIPFDYRKLCWAGPWHWSWQAVDISADLLPEIEPPGSTLGQITAEAAAATGLRPGTPVIAAAADKACEVIGSGALASNVGCLSYGTTATLNTVQRKYVEVHPFIPPYPSAVPGAYNLEAQVYRGYWMVNWFKEQFGHLEQQRAAELGATAESLFDELVNQVPAGSMGLMLQPYWAPGVKVPGPEAKGAILGFGDVHTRAHVYRSIIEGLAYALREGAEQSVRRSRIPISELRVSGGGSQSDAAMQITADIFGRPAGRPHTYETSGLGAAINIAVGLNLHPDYETAVGEMTRVEREFEPRPDNQKIYEELYQRVYKRMYKQLRPLYTEIQSITGYRDV